MYCFFIVTEREFFSINFPLVWVIITLEQKSDFTAENAKDAEEIKEKD